MFGDEIKKVRIEHGLTQFDLAKATKLPQPTISWIESDKGIPNVYQCKVLADYYGITIDELIGRDIDKN